MRLPDPFTHPNQALGFSAAQLIDNEPLIRDELPNGKVLEVKTSAQYWGISIDYPDMTMTEYNFIESFILSTKTVGEYIEVLLPQYEALRMGGSTAAVTIASNQKGNTIVMTNIGALTGTPMAGDLFKLSTHPKVYKITSAVRTSTSLTLKLYPDLMITTGGAEKPVFNGILFRTKLQSGETFGAPLNNDGMYVGASLRLRESL